MRALPRPRGTCRVGVASKWEGDQARSSWRWRRGRGLEGRRSTRRHADRGRPSQGRTGSLPRRRATESGAGHTPGERRRSRGLGDRRRRARRRRDCTSSGVPSLGRGWDVLHDASPSKAVPSARGRRLRAVRGCGLAAEQACTRSSLGLRCLADIVPSFGTPSTRSSPKVWAAGGHGAPCSSAWPCFGIYLEHASAQRTSRDAGGPGDVPDREAHTSGGASGAPTRRLTVQQRRTRAGRGPHSSCYGCGRPVPNSNYRRFGGVVLRRGPSMTVDRIKGAMLSGSPKGVFPRGPPGYFAGSGLHDLSFSLRTCGLTAVL